MTIPILNPREIRFSHTEAMEVAEGPVAEARGRAKDWPRLPGLGLGRFVPMFAKLGERGFRAYRVYGLGEISWKQLCHAGDAEAAKRAEKGHKAPL